MAHKIRFAQAPEIGSLELTEEIIRKRAFRLFELRGCQHGHDLEDWLAAEAEVMGKSAGAATDQKKSTAKFASVA